MLCSEEKLFPLLCDSSMPLLVQNVTFLGYFCGQKAQFGLEHDLIKELQSTVPEGNILSIKKVNMADRYLMMNSL